MNKITGYHESSAMPQRVRDVLGRLKVSIHQNVYEADFEYGPQPLRWEAQVQTNDGSSSITQIPSSGGVRMRVGTSQGDVTIRQSRPYHRYQPGKTMFMATGCNFGTALAGNIQRVGFFDDANGVFFEQGNTYAGNPFGMYVVVRSDVGGTVQETRVGLDQWNGDSKNIAQLDFSRIQMFWIEYGWYGAGATRFGFWIDGEPVVAHQIGWGNYNNTINGAGPQLTPWARTGNLPVRYEQRNLTGTSQSNDMYHYGVSVIVEGQRDEQRGFTYSYGLPNTAPTTTLSASGNNRVPVLTVRGRQMGTQEFGNVYGRNDAGSTPTATGTIAATFTGYISGTTLTLTGATPVSSGTIAVGGTLLGTGTATSSSNNGMLIPFTTITAGSGQTTGSTWTVSISQTIGSAASPVTFTLAGTYMTITGTPLTVNQYQGRNIFFPNQGATNTGTFTANITVGSTTITNISSMTNIYVGTQITGAGYINGNAVPTFVTSVNASGSSITVSLPMIATGTGVTLTYTNTFGNGAIGRITYNSTSTFYFCDPVLQNAIPQAPTIVTTPISGTTVSGSSGAYTITATATGVTVGMSVVGTNIAPGAQVTRINGSTYTLNLPNVGAVGSTCTFNTGYIIGLSNRGQLLPRRLYVSQSAVTQVLVEVIASTPTNPTVLTNPNFVALQYLGSVYSFAERDVLATAITGGEVVFAFVLSSGSGVQDVDFSYFFPLYNNIKGSGIDTLTIAVSNASGTAPIVGCNLICQEAMS
jgi:hypothetical protein